MDFNTPVRYFKGIGPSYAKKLAKLEIHTVNDLLLHIPTRYEDLSLISKIAQLQAGETATVNGQISQITNIQTRYKKIQLQSAVVSDDTGSIEALWFNQPYIVHNLKQGDQIILSGKVTRDGAKLKFQSPEYEIFWPGKQLIHTGRLVPIYPQTAGINSKWLRTRIYQLLNSDLVNADFLPAHLVAKYNFPKLSDALKQIHFPASWADISRARQRLAFDELLITQLQALIKRKNWQRRKLTQQFRVDQDKLQQFINSLPFVLTQSQSRAIKEITADLTNPFPMNRLLQGDVGSGKTVVAAAAMYLSCLNQLTSAIMVPTEILAQQHFQTLTQLFHPLGIQVGILTSSQKKTNSQTQIVIGTHALIQNKVNFQKLGLIVIDEQHRFGVSQRAKLRKKGSTPHVLTMTATPIPRTISLSLYGHLDISLIDEMPSGRIPVKTWLVPPQKRAAAYNWIRQQIKSSQVNKQAFIVCPFIDPSESITTVKAASKEFERLQQQIFPDLKLALLHGKMKSTVKDQVLINFRQGKFDILVCTPVVEVGIDIPNATIMLIEAAERFGLAQLHQLRGRVGRSNQQSFCLLFTSEKSPPTTKRLKALEKNHRGLELAEIDLKIRGPGTIYGTAQHGREFFKVASLNDLELVNQAQLEAQQLLDQDAFLDQYPGLKQRVLSSTISDVSPD